MVLIERLFTRSFEVILLIQVLQSIQVFNSFYHENTFFLTKKSSFIILSFHDI